MASAQRDLPAFADDHAASHPEAAHTPAQDLKLQASERIRLHRERRIRSAHAPGGIAPGTATRPHNPVAESVAARFAQTPSYRAILAEQAQAASRHAVRQAQQARQEAEQAAAEAEIAARNAHAIAHAQVELLAELDLWSQTGPSTPGSAAYPAPEQEPAATVRPFAPGKVAVPAKELSTSGFTVHLYEDLGRSPGIASATRTHHLPIHDSEEARALDDEIAFRQSPVFEPFLIEPTTPLPANLLEFPRHLVAPRKARPLLAEGPLLDHPAACNPQLRIFEVEPSQISTTPAPLSATPEWASIHLDAHFNPEPVPDIAAPALVPSMLPPRTAPVSRRLMAISLDATLVGLAFLAFIAVAAQIAGAAPTGIHAVLVAAPILAVFFLGYELLFFSFSGQTPGMRLARIGLCTLADENPTRSAMRRRILAQLIAVCPFGIGILWSLLDDDGLGWHDRISRMYQRSY